MRLKTVWLLLVVVGFAFASCAKKNAETTTPAEAETKATQEKADTEEQAEEAAADMEKAKKQAPSAKAGVTVAQAEVCEKVDERTPVAPASEFPADIGRVYLFTKVTLDPGIATSIKHVWNYKGEEMASVTLPVRGPSWRTYSSKNIQDFQKGKWAVDITTEEGDLIQSVPFEIK